MTVREWIARGRKLGADMLGIAHDPEALDVMRDVRIKSLQADVDQLFQRLDLIEKRLNVWKVIAFREEVARLKADITSCRERGHQEFHVVGEAIQAVHQRVCDIERALTYPRKGEP